MFKNKIKTLRTARGLSQTALAEAVGVSRRTICTIETEHTDLHLSLAYKLAGFFGTAIEDLFLCVNADKEPVKSNPRIEAVEAVFNSLQGDLVCERSDY